MAPVISNKKIHSVIKAYVELYKLQRLLPAKRLKHIPVINSLVGARIRLCGFLGLDACVLAAAVHKARVFQIRPALFHRCVFIHLDCLS